jgi:hypothetical protein
MRPGAPLVESDRTAGGLAVDYRPLNPHIAGM